MNVVLQETQRVGIYCRLSREDGDNKESSSITSQKELLSEYALKNSWSIYKVYCDDGYSGGNFNRPAFKEMINDIEEGCIDIVITKDLSRLGRNYIESGYYTEEYFPSKNIRYIAVNDNYDTYKNIDDFTPFKNIINQWYLKDLSKKVISVHENRMKKGILPTSNTPTIYGYIINDKKERIINEETAPVVQRIFDLYLKGNQLKNIIFKLKEEKIICPEYYNYLKFGINPSKWANVIDEKKYSWTISRIEKILSNEEYTGMLILKKRKTISYKTHQRVLSRAEEVYKFPDRFEPIITKADFEKASELRKSRSRNRIPAEENPYKNIVYCECCKHPLSLNRLVKNRRDLYLCRNNDCTKKTYVRLDDVNLVLGLDITNIIKICLEHEKEIYEFAKGYNDLKPKINTNSIEKDKLTARNKKLELLIQKLFEKDATGEIPKETYRKMMAEYKTEYENNKTRLVELSVNIPVVKDYLKLTSEFIEELKKINTNNLTKDIITSIIDKAYFTRKDKKLVVKIIYKKIPDLLEDYLLCLQINT